MTQPSDTTGGYPERLMRFLESHKGQRISVSVFSIIATLVLVAFPGGALAYAFGIPFMFFIPGFAVVRLFFWRGTTTEAKAVLSVGLSILVMMLLGLLLVLSPIGLDQNTTRASLILFSLAAVALEVFWLRSDRPAPEGETPQVSTSPVKVDKVVVTMLATALVVSGISLGLIATSDYPSRTYFAVTDPSGLVIMNTTLFVNTSYSVLLHMMNGEEGTRNFTVSAYGVNTTESSTQVFSKVLKKNDLWNQTVTFDLNTTGVYRLDFDLYIRESDKPPYFYGNLHIWITVNEIVG